MYYVYILRSLSKPTNTYVGYTTNLKNRLKSHNEGKSTYTNKYKPWEIIWYCAFFDEKKSQRI